MLNGVSALALVVVGLAQAEIGDLAADRALGQADLDSAVALSIGPGTFAAPKGIAIDRSVVPNRVYVSDSIYHRVLGWSDVDALTNGAPADLVIGQPDFEAFGCNGALFDSGIPAPPTDASLCGPQGLAVDGAGALYVADTLNCRVLVFRDPFGTDRVADLVLGGACGASASELFDPYGVTVDSAGNAFVADTLNCRVLEFDRPLATDTVADRVFGQTDFTSRNCSAVYFPTGVAVDSGRRLWMSSFADVVGFTNGLGAGGPTPDHRLGSRSCNDGGEGASTTCGSVGVATDGARLYVADSGNSRVLAFDAPATTPQAAQVFGRPDFGGTSDLFHDACNLGGASARSLCLRKVRLLTLGGTYDEAGGVAVDGAGRLYVADGLNHRVLRYDAPRTTDPGADLTLGHATMTDVRRPTFPVHTPHALVSRSTFAVAVAEEDASRVLLFASFGDYPDTPLGVIGQPDLRTTGCNALGLSAASLCMPTAVVEDGDGNLWIVDSGNHRVLEFTYPWFGYDYATRQYVTKAIADRVYGQPGFTSSRCAAGPAGLCDPRGVAVDAAGELYISDAGNNRIVHHQNPQADAVAERVYGQADFSGTGCNPGGVGPSTLCDPRGIIADRDGNLLIADRGNNRVVVYAGVASAGGGADRVFGQGGNTAANLPGSGAGGLDSPVDVALDRLGNLYVADQGNNRVLEFDAPLAGDAFADRVFGQPDFGSVGCNTGGVSADSLCAPASVSVVDAYGLRVLVADAGNERVLRYDSPFCQQDFRLTAANAHDRTLRSRPLGAKIQTLLFPGSGDDMLLLKGKNFLLETDGGIDQEEPLVTLSTASGIVFREKVPHMRNIKLTDTTEVWSTEYLEGERDRGFDDFLLKVKWRPSRDFGLTPDTFKIDYRGRAVGLDLAGFRDATATLQLQWGALCFTTDLRCASGTAGPRCKPAK